MLHHGASVYSVNYITDTFICVFEKPEADFLFRLLNILPKEPLNACQNWSIQWGFGRHRILYEIIKTKTTPPKK